MLCHLRDAAVHRQVVVPGGDDQVRLLDQPVVVDLVVMDQRAARRFGDADAFVVVRSGVRANVLARGCLGLSQQDFDPLDGEQDLDQPRIVVVERAQHEPALKFAELRQFLVGQRCAAVLGHVQARQRPDAINAVRDNRAACSTGTSGTTTARPPRRCNSW